MKKIFMVLVMASALFCGCGKEENSDVSEYYNEVSKAQEIAVVSADTSSVIQTITGKEGIGILFWLWIWINGNWANFQAA